MPSASANRQHAAYRRIPDLRLRVVPALSEVDADAWNACANPGISPLLI